MCFSALAELDYRKEAIVKCILLVILPLTNSNTLQ